MPAPLDLVGERFVRLTVIEKSSDRRGASVLWVCRCDCGGETLSSTGNLRGGYSKSCGCIKRENLVQRNSKDVHQTPEERKEYERLYSIANRERIAARMRRRYQGLSDEERERERLRLLDYRKENPEQHRKTTRKARIKLKFGITPEEYDQRFAAAGGKCEICSRDLLHGSEGGLSRKALDHCHATGKLRGFLCHGCNLGIANFKESASSLRRAVEYLERYQ